ncbi:MAG: metallopeptidase domain-containing protein [Anaerolineae bacterium]
MKRAHKFLWVALALSLMAPWLGPFSVVAPVQADDSLEERVLRDAAAALGWSQEVSQSSLFQLGADDESMMLFWPAGSGLPYMSRSRYTATNGGSYEEETIQYARILNMGEEGGRYFIEKFVENGYRHSSYQGRDAVILHAGDEMCNPGGLVGYLSEMVREWFASIFGDAADMDCPYASAGYIAWTCGSYVFVARDDSGLGGEDAIAAALYAAAEKQGMCALGDTLVILAGTADTPGAEELAHFQEMAQSVNTYYGQNSYGRVLLTYTFMDADGSEGSEDWYEVGPTLADYAGKETDFAIAAVKEAFAEGAPRDELELARVIVVYAGQSAQATHDAATPAPLSTLCSMPPNGMWHEIEVGTGDATSKVFAGSLVVVAEEDGLGLWAHEVGHTLYSQYKLFNKWQRISDRYNYQQPWGQYGNIDNWGLMGSGNWWGDPLASAPVHMSSFAKESAEWLSYTDAQVDTSYTLTALENQQFGDSVLRLDDPTSADPNRFFILEARDASAPYGAPESGVVFYRVSWSAAHGHHIVNSLAPQSGTAVGSGAGGRSYLRPGFHSGSTVQRWPGGKLEFILESESTAQGYSAVVSVNVYTPTNLVGAVMALAGGAVPAPAGPPTVTASMDAPLPDIDLHAYDEEGRHVGLNYETGQYESEIPGAVASGDLKDAEEWIYVPEGTQVRFEVSAYKTAQFLAANPAYAAEAEPQPFEVTYQRFDAEGNLTETKAIRDDVEAGVEASLKSPGDASLAYKPARLVGYGKNLPEDLLRKALIAAILAMGLVGWVIMQRRR